eukprot:GFUD01127386.1.p1 GENE.GFUD01127386.1~~GFUD01127386.1.p1  ORF type:complete len:107 (+),score=11.75 GFUD01127386.1:139-459(+)
MWTMSSLRVGKGGYSSHWSQERETLPSAAGPSSSSDIFRLFSAKKYVCSAFLHVKVEGCISAASILFPTKVLIMVCLLSLPLYLKQHPVRQSLPQFGKTTQNCVIE